MLLLRFRQDRSLGLSRLFFLEQLYFFFFHSLCFTLASSFAIILFLRRCRLGDSFFSLTFFDKEVASMLARTGLLLSVFFLCTQHFAQAGLITNGDFETGDLTAWTVSNSSYGPLFASADVVSPGGTQGDHYASLSVFTYSLGYWGYADIYQQTNIKAGDVLSFDYRSAEGTSSLIITNVGGTSSIIALPFSTSWTSYSKSFTLAGTYQIEFKKEISGFSCKLDIDNVQVNSVPEPSTLSILVIGLIGSFFYLDRRANHER